MWEKVCDGWSVIYVKYGLVAFDAEIIGCLIILPWGWIQEESKDPIICENGVDGTWGIGSHTHTKKMAL